MQTSDSRKQRKRADAERRNRLSPLKAQIAKYDDMLARLAKDAAAVQTQLATPDLYSDGAKERLRELLEEQAALARETQKIEAAWLEASERLEAETSQLESD
jgi:ATP-binding cassette subfamily F protein 3